VIGDDKGLPASLAGLFGAAAGLYARRFPLYATLAVLAIGVQYIVDTLVLPGDFGLLLGLDIIIGGFLAATVSIGTAFDLQGKEADWSRIVTAASLRWGVVTLIAFLAQFVYALFAPYLTLPLSQTGFGLLILPFIVIWAAVWMSMVVASIEPAQSRLLLPLLALGKGLGVSTRFTNLGRLMLYALLMLIPIYAEMFAETTLLAHKIPDSVFWSNVTIDMIALGPLQALATVFYVDFLRRAGR
jgi:hypothetical protein